MSTSFNSKKVASDIAKGAMHLNPVTMKRYTTDDLKALMRQLLIAQRDIRGAHVSQEDQAQSNMKNRQLQYIHQAISMMNGYAKKHHVRL